LKPGENDLAFCKNVDAYMKHLTGEGLIEEHRITRRKLGLAPAWSTEFHILVGTRDLAQLDTAFTQVAKRSGAVEDLHRAVYSAVTNLSFALYRDFPSDERSA